MLNKWLQAVLCMGFVPTRPVTALLPTLTPRHGSSLHALMTSLCTTMQGRGIFVAKDQKFILWINEGDHVRIISMEQGGDVKAVFTRLSKGIAAIEAGLQKITGDDNVFMRDDRIGIIACCPSNLGTAMRGSVHIMVPKLIEKMGLQGIDDLCRERNCQARGSSGEHSAVVDRIDISNWRRLGFRECDLVQDMIRTANYLAELEAELEAGGAGPAE